MISIVVDAMGIAGAVLVAYGAWRVYPPAGIILAGLMLLMGCILWARGADSTQGAPR
jgi:hypothetical protein